MITIQLFIYQDSNGETTIGRVDEKHEPAESELKMYHELRMELDRLVAVMP
jgi:hypothetical protein